MEGIVFDIQRTSYHDGPGLRTAVFLKGCGLRCAWCHNPESFRVEPELEYDSGKCTGCGACVPACPTGAHRMQGKQHQLDRGLCTGCGTCVPACPAGALRLWGRSMQAQEVMRQVMLDKKYYDNSGGGVTFTGGEPTVQYEFLQQLLTLAKENGLHVCLETNGMLPFARLQPLLKRVDLLLLDYKLTDPALHRQHTGGGNAPLLDNIRRLGEMDFPFLLRLPIIPGINDTEDHFAAVRALLRRWPNIQRAEVMAYHRLGEAKWNRLGLASPLAGLPDATPEQKQAWQRQVDRE